MHIAFFSILLSPLDKKRLCGEQVEPRRRLFLLPKHLSVGLAVGIKAIMITPLPSGFQFRLANVPIRTAFLQHSTQVVTKLFDGWSAEKPVAVVDLEYNETRFEDDDMGDHRIVFGVRVLSDVLSRGGFCPKDRRQAEGLVQLHRCCTYGEAYGSDASKHRKLRTRFDSLISRRHWHNFYADIRKERMATSSRRGLDGFLTSATHSKRCTGQGIEMDSTPFGAFALRYFARQAYRRTDQTVDGPFAELDGPLRRAITARHGLSSRMVRES
jgi:hypothetical protein